MGPRLPFSHTIAPINKSAKWHCGHHTLICKKKKATAHESQMAEQNGTRDVFLSWSGKFYVSIWRHETVSKQLS